MEDTPPIVPMPGTSIGCLFPPERSHISSCQDKNTRPSAIKVSNQVHQGDEGHEGIHGNQVDPGDEANPDDERNQAERSKARKGRGELEREAGSSTQTG